MENRKEFPQKKLKIELPPYESQFHFGAFIQMN
jgi:hypothetical protein